MTIAGVLTSGQLNRATLQRQLLLARQQLAPIDAVRRIVALQAQEPAAPYVALWNRVTDLDLGDVDRALSVRALVKASLMRVTLHAVAADDYPTFHAAVTPILRASRLNDRRFKDTGLSTDDADEALPGLLEYLAEPRTRQEIIEYLGAGVSDEPRLWWALRTYAPILRSPTGALWTYGREPAYERAPDLARPSYDDAVATLFRRYLAGYGPARAVDFAQFTLLSMSTINPIIEAIRDDLVVYTDTDGRELFDVSEAPDIPDGTEPAPVRLLGMWDSVLLAYRDRSRVVSDDIRRHVISRNGDVLPSSSSTVTSPVPGASSRTGSKLQLSPHSPITPGTNSTTKPSPCAPRLLSATPISSHEPTSGGRRSQRSSDEQSPQTDPTTQPLADTGAIGKNGAAAPLAGTGERANLDYIADVLISNTALRKQRLGLK